MIGVALSANYPGQWLPLAIFYSILAGVSFLGTLLLAISGVARAQDAVSKPQVAQAQVTAA